MLSLTFENTTKRFGETVAVNDLSLRIEAGELFFLLGPSGCGKTTCLRMVAGFETPDEGVLRFGERVVNEVPPHKRNAGMVFQNYALWPHLTAGGNVEYGLKIRKVPHVEREKQVRAAPRMVRLEHLIDRYPGQMSGGQQQRVALARALVIRPVVLLLDEPLSNLDAQLRLEMRHEIKELHSQSGATALYVTHDQEEALSIADRIAVLQDGVLRQIGTPRDLYRRPQSRFVAEFIGETNFLPGTVAAVESGKLLIETPAGVLRAALPDEPPPVGAAVWCSIRPEAWRVTNATDARSGDATNRLPAELEAVTYLGRVEQYLVRLSGGRETAGEDETWRQIKAAAIHPGGQPPASRSVMLYCDPADVVVLRS
jgi:iron(III) transport system ATP-binding protein